MLTLHDDRVDLRRHTYIFTETSLKMRIINENQRKHVHFTNIHIKVLEILHCSIGSFREAVLE